MDYAAKQQAIDPASYGVLGGLAKQIKQDTSLDRLSNAADRVERITYLVETFNDRFYSGAVAETASPCRPVPAGHEGQIGRLFEAIDQLDSVVQRLQSIG